MAGRGSVGRMTAVRRHSAKKSYAVVGLFLLFVVTIALLS